jgi:hypothetical protein
LNLVTAGGDGVHGKVQVRKMFGQAGYDDVRLQPGELAFSRPHPQYFQFRLYHKIIPPGLMLA